MEIKYLNKTDKTKIVAVQAKSFPEGIVECFESLYKVFKPEDNRRVFGLSRPERGTIIYKAAAEVIHLNDLNFGFEEMMIPPGKYVYIEVADFMNNHSQIGAAFELLLKEPGIDGAGYCLEEYYNSSNVRCMVRIAPAKPHNHGR